MTSPSGAIRRGNSPLGDPSAGSQPLLGLLSLLPPQFQFTYKTFFTYNGNILPLTASVTGQVILTIDTNSHFITSYATCIVTDTTDLIQLSFIPETVQITDSSSQSTWFLAPLHAMAFYGDAGQPGIMAVPYITSPGASLTIVHTNLEAVNRNVRIALAGFKSYPGTDTREQRWQR